ncbi:hypothetical protein K0U00_41745, partial [Paenibacillus sepulcri]|nr:hypothetical protein [Paenibacillus sepulcri]
VTGAQPGQYPAGAKAALLAAIDDAKAVAGDSGSTSEEVAGAVTDLNAALQTFKAAVITGIPGDINHDDKVSIGDLAIVAAGYGKTSADPNWSQYEKSDYNSDGKIDIEDLSALARLILG